MKLNILTAKIVGALHKASSIRNNKKIRLSYSLDYENKLVSIVEADLVFKNVVVTGHMGTGSQWKKKSWVESSAPRRTIFTGKAKDALIFLANGAV